MKKLLLAALSIAVVGCQTTSNTTVVDTDFLMLKTGASKSVIDDVCYTAPTLSCNYYAQTGEFAYSASSTNTDVKVMGFGGAETTSLSISGTNEGTYMLIFVYVASNSTASELLSVKLDNGVDLLKEVDQKITTSNRSLDIVDKQYVKASGGTGFYKGLKVNTSITGTYIINVNQEQLKEITKSEYVTFDLINIVDGKSSMTIAITDSMRKVSNVNIGKIQ